MDQRVDRWLRIAAITALVLASAYYAFVLGDARAAIADFYPINGDYQNFNPVHRLFLGEYPARDFDSYLGLGPVYLQYFVMLVTGADFTSSLFAMHWLHAVASFATIVLLCRLCRLPWFWTCLLGWFLLVYARSPAFLPVGKVLYDALSELVQPHNSSLGLRCLPSVLAAPAVLWVFRRVADGRREERWAGLCLGAIGGAVLPWSNDHGLPTALAMAVVGGTWLVWQAPTYFRALQAVVLLPLAMGLSAAAVLLIATGGGLMEWYAYNFQNVAKDQYWYYLGDKVTSIRDVPIYGGAVVAAGCLGVLAWRVRRRGGRPEDAVLALVVLANLLAGYVSISGAIGDRYFYPLYRCLMIVAPWLAWSIVWQWLGSRRVGMFGATVARYRGSLAAAAVGGLVACGLLASLEALEERRERTTEAAESLEVAELGGTIDHEYGKAIALAREIRARADAAGVADRERLFSTYTSAMDLVAGARRATRSDYIIHALGPQRRGEYVRDFQAARPMFVTTIRDDFTHWENWVRKMNWDFYAELLTHYQPTDRTLYNVVWERRKEPAVWPEIAVETSVRQIADSEVELRVHFPAAAGQSNERHLVEVEVEYDWQWKPERVLRGGLRPYLFARDTAQPTGWGLPKGWGLAPYETTHRFPVELAPGETSVVSVSCQPLDSTQLTIRHLRARVVCPKRQIDGFPLSRLIASSLSDTNWDRGIWHYDSRAALFVADMSDLEGIGPGSRLRFRTSGERVVQGVSNDQVWLEGPPLDPAGDGYPHSIEIVR